MAGTLLVCRLKGICKNIVKWLFISLTKAVELLVCRLKGIFKIIHKWLFISLTSCRFRFLLETQTKTL